MARDSRRTEGLTDLTLLGAVVIGGGMAAVLLVAAIDLVLMLNGG